MVNFLQLFDLLHLRCMPLVELFHTMLHELFYLIVLGLRLLLIISGHGLLF